MFFKPVFGNSDAVVLTLFKTTPTVNVHCECFHIKRRNGFKMHLKPYKILQFKIDFKLKLLFPET